LEDNPTKKRKKNKKSSRDAPTEINLPRNEDDEAVSPKEAKYDYDAEIIIIINPLISNVTAPEEL
jgi:hypothetical protein